MYTNEEGRIWNKAIAAAITRVISTAPRPGFLVSPNSSTKVRAAIDRAQIGLRDEIEDNIRSLRMGLPEDAKTKQHQSGEAGKQPATPQGPPLPQAEESAGGNGGGDVHPVRGPEPGNDVLGAEGERPPDGV